MNRFVDEDAALGQPEPDERVAIVELDRLDEAVESVDRFAGAQQRHAHIVQQFVLVITADGEQWAIRQSISCNRKKHFSPFQQLNFY